MSHLPKQLISSLCSLPDFSESEFTEVHREGKRVTSIRLNPYKNVELDFELGQKIPWSTNSFYLDQRPSFTYDPLFHAGAYYVQEAGSIFIEYLLKQCVDFSKELKILDLCASPGGKSTLIASLLNNESLLVSNEVIKSRVNLLAGNLSKWGRSNVLVSSADPAAFSNFSSYFDVIVADVPCSGSGLFRKQPESVKEWSQELVHKCASRQKRILADSVACLKKNGLLLYSTCSYSIEENEENVQWLIDEFGFEPVVINVEKEWGIINNSLGYRFYPDKTRSEGFFCSILIKKQNNYVKIAGKYVKKQSNRLKTIQLPHFNAETPGEVIELDGRIHFLYPSASICFKEFYGKLHMFKAGSLLGQMKNKDFIPHHEMALSVDFKVPNEQEINRENAVKFLKKNELQIEKAAVGFCRLTYRKLGLGWVKFINGRMNNYLPSELRILN